MSHSDPNTGDDAKTLGASLDVPSESSDASVVAAATQSVTPLPGIERCDCRIQVLDAMRLQVATWTIATVPDLEIWAGQVAAWMAELPTELLLQGWMVQFILALEAHAGLSVSRASDLIQLAVGRALLTKEGWR